MTSETWNDRCAAVCGDSTHVAIIAPDGVFWATHGTTSFSNDEMVMIAEQIRKGYSEDTEWPCNLTAQPYTESGGFKSMTPKYCCRLGGKVCRYTDMVVLVERHFEVGQEYLCFQQADQLLQLVSSALAS
jgi:hypothetical protein